MEIQDVVKVEKVELVKTKDLCSKILFIKDNAFNMVMLQFKNDEEKHFMRKKSLELVKKMDVDRYWFSSTAWFLTQDKKGNAPYRRPSRDANRKEGFMVVEFRKDRKNKVYFAEIKRDIYNNVTFLENEEMTNNLNSQDNLSSYWDAWVDEKELDIKTAKEINEQNENFIKKVTASLMKKHKDEFKNIKSTEEFLILLNKLVLEANEKFDKQNKTLLEDPEEFED
jgi:hypothetical protein